VAMYAGRLLCVWRQNVLGRSLKLNGDVQKCCKVCDREYIMVGSV